MNGRVGKTLFVRQQFLLYEREGERRVPPAVLEDAVDAVEQEEHAVQLGHGKLDLSCAECLDGDGVRPRELEQEHHAVFVHLKHSAVCLRQNGQGERLTDSKIY